MSSIEASLNTWSGLALSALLIGIGALFVFAGLFAPTVIKLPLAIWAVL